MIFSRITIVLFLLLSCLGANAQYTGYMGKKMTVELGVGINPNITGLYGGLFSERVEPKPSFFKPIIKLNFGYALNRINEIGLSYRYVNYEMGFRSFNLLHESGDFYIGPEITNEGQNSTSDYYYVLKNSTLHTIQATYKYYYGGSIAPLGKYIKLSAGVVLAKVQDSDELSGYEGDSEDLDPYDGFDFKDNAVIGKISLGYYYKMAFGDGFYFSAGAEMNIHLNGWNKPSSSGYGYKLYYQDEQEASDLYIPYNLGYLTRKFEFVNFDFGIGKIF